MRVELDGYCIFENDTLELEDIPRSISIVLTEMLHLYFRNKPAEKSTVNMNEIAEVLLDKAKDIVSEYYDAVKEKQEENDLYKFMEQLFEYTIKKFDIDEDKILKLAQTEKPKFDVKKDKELYFCNVIFGDTVFTLGTIPCNLAEEELYKESFKASITATILFDKAFSDESKNPLRSNKISNLYFDLIDKIQKN